MSHTSGKGIIYPGPPTALKKGIDYEVQAFVTGQDKRAAIKEESNVVHFVNAEELPSETEAELVAEPEPEKKEEEKPASIPWIPFDLVVALLNAGFGFSLVQNLKKAQTSVSFTLPEFPESKEFAKALEALQAKAALTEISLDDPLLTGAEVTGVAPGISAKDSSADTAEAGSDTES